ncbi:M14 family metallopeptidase [Bordetella genomosp. 9]|uniref:Deacylase n=1 Tax=Bordetella genomosp. 9 TaxID=1416803 RepID=A0A1W6YW51_9BORD|nr:M14 family metallopeptidase [Bordetella genomosp. 9]ARP85327.1 deacylase [Bordetella genomosp. 9]
MSGILESWQAFALDYADGRARFIAAARALDAPLWRYPHPTAQGPDGQPLSVDVARLGPADASRTLLVVSGTHGLEGAAGSAAQVAWMATPAARQLPADTNVVLVHAINPYGWAYQTRTTENNVDLNRNFVDHEQPYPVNAAYDELHPHLIPLEWTDAGQAGVRQAIETFRAKHGDDALFNATASGQYRHPRGLVYGGQGREWSNLTLERILSEHLARSERVAFIDWHTGIGEYGEPFFLCFNDEGSETQQQAAQWWGRDRVLGQRPHGLARPDYQGLVFRGVEAFLPGRKVAGAVVEFGTRGLHMREALRLDQWLRFRAPERPDPARDRQLRADLIDAFVPYAGHWRRSVIRHGIEITGQALNGLAAWH